MRVVVLLACFLATLAWAQDGARVRLVDWSIPVPKGWKQEPPESSMRLTQFQLPGAASGGPGQVAVFYFGTAGGGPIRANIERWTSQFTTPRGGPVRPVVTKGRAGGMPATHVELDGSYARGAGAGPRGTPLADQALRVTVIETPKGNLTFQLWGHRDAVGAHRKAFDSMIQAIRQP